MRKTVPASIYTAVLAASMILPQTTAKAAAAFADVQNGYWAYSYIQSLAEKGIINGYDGKFEPEASVTRAQFAKMLVNTLNLQTTHPATPSFVDVTPDSWEYEYIETAYKKGLLNGVGDNRFEPASLITRQDMAKMIGSALPVKFSEIRPDIRSKLSFADNSRIADYAKEFVAVGSFLGLLNGQPGNLFVPTGNATRAEASALVDRFSKLSQEQIQSLTEYGAAQLQAGAVTTPFTAGAHAIFTIRVVNPKGELMQNDNNRKISITVSQPIPKDPSANYAAKEQVYAATTQNGAAQFAIPVTKAGLYRVEAVSDGLQGVKEATFTVVPAKAEKLYLTASPSPFLLPGASANITVRAVDKYNNPVQNVSDVPVSISLFGQGALEKTTATLKNGVAAVGTLKAGTTPGELKLQASTAKGGLSTDSYTVTVVKDQTQFIAGKGMWLMWRDWYRQDTNKLIEQAKQNGVTHLYVHAATTTDGIFALDALDDLLPLAHRNGIMVVGWVYSDLRNPLADAARDIKVAQYVTPSGDKIDALTTDIEDAQGTTEANVNSYSTAMRAAISNHYPFYATTYPPSMRPNYPWKSFGTYYDAIIPMDYWHFKYRVYTQTEVYNFIVQSVADIRRLTGKADMPISIAGQGYDMFSDGDGSQNPSPQEVQGAMQGAKDAGALGFSMYRWGTMSQAQWDTFGKFKW